MTISNGGVLPRIHPELLSKKRGGKVKVETQVTVPEKRENRKPVKKPSKKSKGKPGRKPKVRAVSYLCCSGTIFVCENTKKWFLHTEKHREWQRSRRQHNSGRRTRRGIYYSLCEKLVPWTKGGNSCAYHTLPRIYLFLLIFTLKIINMKINLKLTEKKVVKQTFILHTNQIKRRFKFCNN